MRWLYKFLYYAPHGEAYYETARSQPLSTIRLLALGRLLDAHYPYPPCLFLYVWTPLPSLYHEACGAQPLWLVPWPCYEKKNSSALVREMLDS
jgi:hypothetical protein